jgi:hypothetical protein
MKILIVILLGFENGGVFCNVLSCNYIIAMWFIINSIGNERAGCNNNVVSDFIYIYIKKNRFLSRTKGMFKNQS